MIVIGVVVAVLPAAGPEPAVASPATAGHRRSAGRHQTGYLIRGQWFGSWRVRDGIGFCIEFDQGHPDSKGARRLRGGRVPGMSAEDSARVAHVVGRYARSSSRVESAAAAIYVWQRQHTKRFDRYYAKMIKEHAIPGRVRGAVRRIAREARNHGPYRLAVSLGAGYVGQTINGTVSAYTRSRRPAAGLPVRLTGTTTGVLTSSRRRTGRDGTLRFTVKVVKPGPVRITARLRTPKPSGVWVTRPTRGHQRLVLAGSVTETVRATASSQRGPDRPTLTSQCASDCAGLAPVTLSVRNPCGAATLRQLVLSNGAPIAHGTLDVPACRTVRRTWRLPDAAVVTTRYCYLDARRRCSTRWLAQPGRLVVVCPPPVLVRLTATCPCVGPKSVTYALFGPTGSARRYVATLVVRTGDTSATTRINLHNGRWQSFRPVRVPKGSSVDLSATVLGRTRVLDRFRQT